MATVDDIILEHEDVYANFVDAAKQGDFPSYIGESFAEYHTKILNVLRKNFRDNTRTSEKAKKAEEPLDFTLKEFYKKFKETSSDNLIENVKAAFTREEYETATENIIKAYEVANTKVSKDTLEDFAQAYDRLTKARIIARKRMVDHIYGTKTEAETPIELVDDSPPLNERYDIKCIFYVKAGKEYVKKAEGSMNKCLTDPNLTTIFGKRAPSDSMFYQLNNILSKDNAVSGNHGRFEVVAADNDSNKKGDLIYCDTSKNRSTITDYKGNDVSTSKERDGEKTEVIRTLFPNTFKDPNGSSTVEVLGKYKWEVSLEKKPEETLRLAPTTP